MKHILLENFRIPARRIAEHLWGTGGTTSYRTNRKGAYYYSCSGHGGYVVDSRALTTEEKKEIDKYTKPYNLDYLTQIKDGEKYIIHVYMDEFTPRYKRIHSYNPKYHYPEICQDIKIYIFEEDCDWSILEKLTDIKLIPYIQASPEDQIKHNEAIEKTFDRWITKRTKV